MESSYASDKDEPVWLIVWMITRGGRTGYSKSCMTYEKAVEFARAKNVEQGDKMSHWVQHKDEPLPQN
jgi:hypothetical protein